MEKRNLLVQEKIFIVFDIETLVDEKLFEEAAKKRQQDRYNEEDDYVPPAIYHVPVCISYLLTSNGNVQFPLKLTSNRDVIESREYIFKVYFSKSPVFLVNKFFEILGWLIGSYQQNRKGGNFVRYPILVSYNGTRFDLPLLTAMALKHYEGFSNAAKSGLREFLDESDKWERERANYSNKYSSYHIDAYRYFYSSLKSVGKFYGLEVKTYMEGKDIKSYFEDGKFKEIALYCAEDVLTLARVTGKLLEAKGEGRIKLPESINECEVYIDS